MTGRAPLAGMTRRQTSLTFVALWTSLSVPAYASPKSAIVATTPVALTPAQAKVLAVVVDLVVPATDTPGGVEAGVPAFVERALVDFCPPADARAIRSGLDRIDRDADAAHGAPFHALSPGQQIALLTRYDQEAPPPLALVPGIGAPGSGRPSGEPHFFTLLKELVTVGYFTSNLGATQAVRYDPVPGPYRGCVPLSEIGRAWAL